MARPPVFPTEEKVRIVLSILAGQTTVAEAARQANVSGQSIGNWKRGFLEPGKTGLTAGRSGPSTREHRLEAEVTDLTQALQGAVELRASRKSAEAGWPLRGPRASLCTQCYTTMAGQMLLQISGHGEHRPASAVESTSNIAQVRTRGCLLAAEMRPAAVA